MKIAVLGCSFALVACGSHAPTTMAQQLLIDQESGIDHADFTTSTEIPQHPPPDLELTTSGNTARAIYATTVSLPVYPPGVFHCLADDGVRYELVFWSGDLVVATATLDPRGCQTVTIDSQHGSLTLRGLGDYYDTLASELGVPTSDLYP